MSDRDLAQGIDRLVAGVSERQRRISSKGEAARAAAMSVGEDEGLGAGLGDANTEPRHALIPDFETVEAAGRELAQHEIGESFGHDGSSP